MVDPVKQDIAREERRRGRRRNRPGFLQPIDTDDPELEGHSLPQDDRRPEVPLLRRRVDELETRKASNLPDLEPGVLEPEGEDELVRLNDRIAALEEEPAPRPARAAPPRRPEPEGAPPVSPGRSLLGERGGGISAAGIGGARRHREATQRFQRAQAERLQQEQIDSAELVRLTEQQAQARAADAQRHEEKLIVDAGIGAAHLRRDLVAGLEGTVPADQLNDAVLEAFQEEILEDPNEGLQMLYEAYREVLPDHAATVQHREDVRNIFMATSGLDGATADEFFKPNVPRLLQHFFPNNPIEDSLALLENNPNVIVERARVLGRTWETQTLLRLLQDEEGNQRFGWDDIGDIFRTKRVVLKIEGEPKRVTVLDNSMVLNADGVEIGGVDPVTLEFQPYQYRLVDDWHNWTASAGDLVATTGAALRWAAAHPLIREDSILGRITPSEVVRRPWMGLDGVGSNLSEFGEAMSAQAPPDTLPPGFTWQMLYNPRWWSNRVLRNAAPTMVQVGAAVMGGWAIGGLKALAMARSFGSLILRSLAPAVPMRAMESALEAGAAYDECLARGLSPVECRDAADQVFGNNMKLVGLDAAQIALAFAPPPARVFGSLADRGLVKTTTVVGRIVFSGLTEGGEEFVQEIIQRDALGNEIVWDDEMQQAVALGTIFGGGLGTGPTMYRAIKSRTIAAFSAETRARFEEALANERGALGFEARPVEAIKAELDSVQATIEYLVTEPQRDAETEAALAQLAGQQAELQEELAELATPIAQSTFTESGEIRAVPSSLTEDAEGFGARIEQGDLEQFARERDRLAELREQEDEGAPVIQQEIEEVQAQIEAMESGGIVRPPWAAGLTNQELVAVAAHEGLNVHQADWFDGLDPVVVREARQGHFKLPDAVGVTELRGLSSRLKTELNALTRTEEAALDAVADEQEVQDIVAAVVETINVEELEKEIQPSDPVDQVVWESILEKIKRELPPIPEVAPSTRPPGFEIAASLVRGAANLQVGRAERARVLDNMREAMQAAEGDAPSLTWTNVGGQWFVEVLPSPSTGVTWTAERLAAYDLEPGALAEPRGNFYRLKEIVPAVVTEPTPSTTAVDPSVPTFLGQPVSEPRRPAAAGGGGRRPPEPPPAAEAAPEDDGDAAVRRIAAKVSLSQPKASHLQKIKRGGFVARRAFENEILPVKEFLKRAEEGGTKLSLEENPYIAMRMVRGIAGKASVFLQEGTFGTKWWKVENGKVLPNFTGESFQDIMDEVKEAGPWENFSHYLVARRSVELANRDIESGIDSDDAVRGIERFEEQNPNFPDLAERIFKYQDALLVYAQESGLISEDLLEKMRELNPSYVPFYRVFEDLAGKGFMGKKMASIVAPIRRIRGSERDVVNPLESIVKNTHTLIDAADRNSVGILMANMVTKNPDLSDVFAPIPTPTSRVAQVSAKELGIEVEGMTEAEAEELVDVFRPSAFVRGDEVTVLIDGKKHYYRVDPDIRDSLLHMDETSLGLLQTILGGPTRWFRAGTVLNPDFIVGRNPWRDTWTSWIYSKYGMLPGIDLVRGVAGLLKRDSDYTLYKLSGAERATQASLDRLYLQRSFKEIVDGRGFFSHVRLLEQARIVADFTENMNRLAEMKAGLRQGRHPTETGFAARDLTLDFQSGGYVNRALNHFIPFWNPTFLSWEKMAREFRENPLRTTSKAFLYITVPSILLYLANRDDPRYKELPQWKKDLFWIVMTDDHIFTIPRPFELGILFGATVERFLEYLDTQDRSILGDLAANSAEAFLPGFMPSIIAPEIEVQANKSFFTGGPIVPASRENLPGELQYTNFTTETAKKVSGILRHIPVTILQKSPAQVDHIIRGWTGGLGRWVTEGIDVVLNETGVGSDIPKPSKGLADFPVAKAFIARTPIGSSSEALNDFYELMEEYTKNEGFLKKMLDEGNQRRYEEFKAKHPELLFFYDYDKDIFYSASARYLRRVARDLAEIRKKQDAIWNHKTMDGKTKRRIIDSLDRIRTDMSRQALDLFFGGDPAVLQVRLGEAEERLGDVISEAPVLSREPTDFYDMRNLSADYTTVLEAVTVNDLKAEEGIPATAFAWYEKEESEAKANAFPNTAIHLINADPEKGTTFEDYVLQSQALKKLTGKERAEFLGDHPQAHLGNLTKAQVAVLRKYHAATPREQQNMLRTDPRLKTNPRDNWLRTHPADNARLALWAGRPLFTQEAYDEFVRLTGELDIPDDAIIPRTFPATDSRETHFAYLKTRGEFGPQSWEAKLILAKDPDYRADFDYEDPDLPITVYELLITDRALYEEEQLFRDTLPRVEDPDDPNYVNGYQSAIAGLKTDNQVWVDNMRRIEALKVGSDEEPTKDEFVSGWVERGHIIDAHSPGSAEALIWLRDNPKVHEWALDRGLLSDDGADWNVPVLRITAAHRETDAAYAQIGSEDTSARRGFRLRHPEWADDQARKQAYQWDPEMPPVMVEAHVAYSAKEDELGGSSAEVMLWRVGDKKGYNEMREAIPKGEDGHLEPVDLDRVPIWRIDVKYRKEDAEYAAIPADSPRRELYLARKPRYRKDRRRRSAHELGVAQEQVEDYVSFHELPDRGYRRDRFLDRNRDYYQDVWLGVLENGAVNFDTTPDEQFDVIYERWPEQMVRYYEEIPEETRLLTGEAQTRQRDKLRRELFFRNPGFQKQLFEYEGHKELVPNDAIPGYIVYRTVRYEGKPAGWETWYADDRVLRDNPAFYDYLLRQGLTPIDFDLIPSESWEYDYNETYLKFRMFGEADRDTRLRYRGAHKDFDLEGVRIGVFSAPHPNRTPGNREGLRGVGKTLAEIRR